MRKINARAAFAVSILALCAALAARPDAAVAQTTDPLVGTWNVTGAASNPPFIAVMTFNEGGTEIEYDTAGTNSSASPGESINLGKWKKTTTPLTYKFKEQNYVYDSSGNLSLIDITTATIKLNSTGNQFSGTGVTSFYNCSLSLCPGTLVVSLPFEISAKRF